MVKQYLYIVILVLTCCGSCLTCPMTVYHKFKGSGNDTLARWAGIERGGITMTMDAHHIHYRRGNGLRLDAKLNNHSTDTLRLRNTAFSLAASGWKYSRIKSWAGYPSVEFEELVISPGDSARLNYTFINNENVSARAFIAQLSAATLFVEVDSLQLGEQVVNFGKYQLLPNLH